MALPSIAGAYQIIAKLEEEKVVSNDYWTINRAGYVFSCNYDRKNDWVEVDCENLNMSKGALGKGSGPEIIANILVGEILREYSRLNRGKE